MKGYLTKMYPSSDGEYSDLQVLQSPAGWYVGIMFHNNDGFDEPGSRESQYFDTEALAKQALNNKSLAQRTHP